MIGDMISHQDNQCSDNSNDKSSVSNLTESKDYSHSLQSEKNSQDTHDEKAIEIVSSGESEDKTDIAESPIIQKVSEMQCDPILISKTIECDISAIPIEPSLDQAEHIVSEANPELENKPSDNEENSQISQNAIIPSEETKGNLIEDIEEPQEMKNNVDENASSNIEESKDIHSILENNDQSSHVSENRWSNIPSKAFQSFFYPQTKEEINDKIYLAGCYSSDDLKKWLSLIDHRELDVYKKDQRERQMWSDLMGDSNFTHNLEQQMDVDTLSSDEDKKDDEDMTDIEEIVGQSSEDESIIGRTPQIPDPVKRQKIWESILSCMPDVDNDSFDDEDELVFAVKINELINPEYVEFTRTKRVKILKPLLQKKRDGKDFVKELEDEMLGSKRSKWNLDQSKFGNNSLDFQNKTSISEFFKNRQMQGKQQNVYSNSENPKYNTEEDFNLKNRLSAIKNSSIQDKVSKPNSNFSEINKRLNPVQNTVKRGLQASIERHKIQSSTTQQSKQINSLNNFQKPNDSKIVELEDNDDDVKIIESEWVFKKKPEWVKVKIEENKSFLSKPPENRFQERENHIDKLRNLISNSKNNLLSNKMSKPDLQQVQNSSNVKDEAKRNDTYENRKIGLAAKLEKINKMHKNAKNELQRSEQRINIESDSSSKNLDSNRENDERSDDKSNSLFSSESSDENDNSRSRSKSIDINENSYDEEDSFGLHSKLLSTNHSNQIKSSNSIQDIKNYFKSKESLYDSKNKQVCQSTQSNNLGTSSVMDAKSMLKNLLDPSRSKKIWSTELSKHNSISSGLGWQDKPLEIEDDSDEIQEVKKVPDRKIKQSKLIIHNDRVTISGRNVNVGNENQVNPLVWMQTNFESLNSDSEDNQLKNEDSYDQSSSCFDQSCEKIGMFYSSSLV